ncbi:tetratricopeptide repeat protein [candidate division TA06 bacterium]|nr:tetratricopeptide repeat protein [candidate division TA06 bacterium]
MNLTPFLILIVFNSPSSPIPLLDTLENLQSVLAQNPLSDEVHYQIAKLYLGQREYERARNHLETILSMNEGEKEEIHFALGRIALVEANLKPAPTQEEYEIALKHFTQGGGDPFILGYCSERLSRWEEAIGFYGLVLESPFDDYARFRIGQILEEMGWVDAASAVYNTLLDRHPESIHFLSALKKIPRSLEKGMKWEEAIRKREEILQGIRKGEFGIRKSALRTLEVEMKVGIAKDLTELGRIGDLRGRKEGARKIYREVLRNYPSTFYALRALHWLEKEKSLSSQDRYYAGQVHLLHKNYPEAIRDFRTYLRRHSKGRWARRTQRLLADAYYNDRRFEEAKKIYQRIQSGQSADQILYKIARCEERMNREEEAYQRFLELADLFPKGSLSDNALYRAGMIMERKGNHREAIPLYVRLVLKLPRGNYADDGWYRLGLSALRTQDLDLAHLAFYGLLKDYPQSSHRPGAYYWLGRIYEEKGDSLRKAETDRLLMEEFPTHYYTQLTGKWLNGYSLNLTTHPIESAIGGQDSTAKHLAPPVAGQAGEIPITDISAWIASWAETLYTLSPDEEMHLERGRRLLWMGLLEEGRRELSRIDESNPLFLYHLALLYKKSGLDYEPIVLGEKIRQQFKKRNQKSAMRNDNFALNPSSLPFGLLEILYPISYLPTLYEVSKRDILVDDSTNMPEHTTLREISFLLALLRMESGFNPKAVSRAGARGLAQIMPETGEKIAKSLNQPDFLIDDLFHPKKNISFGSWYLSALRDTVREIVNTEWGLGNEESRTPQSPYENIIEPLVLAAYNGGPHNVRKWVENGILNAEWGFGNAEFHTPHSALRALSIESIPFFETRAFVKKVLGNEGIYRKILSHSSPNNPPNHHKN